MKFILNPLKQNDEKIFKAVFFFIQIFKKKSLIFKILSAILS